MIALDIDQFKDMLAVAAEVGANSALVNAGLKKAQISKAEAYRRYGRKKIDRWIKDKIVIPIPIGKTSVVLSVNDLEAVTITRNLYKKHLSSKL